MSTSTFIETYLDCRITYHESSEQFVSSNGFESPSLKKLKNKIKQNRLNAFEPVPVYMTGGYKEGVSTGMLTSLDPGTYQYCRVTDDEKHKSFQCNVDNIYPQSAENQEIGDQLLTLTIVLEETEKEIKDLVSQLKPLDIEALKARYKNGRSND